MNVHELPLILFTVLGQMSVGAFVVLGVVQVLGRWRYGRAAVDAIADPALYAIGPVLVLGLLASMLHLGNPMNAINTLRHLDSSWLSREIVFGVAFAGLGFLFAALQFFRWGTPLLRQVVAAVTAVVGLAFIWVMSMVYASLPTVPAWNMWTTPAQFYLTALLLGTLAVGAAFMGVTMSRRQHLRERLHLLEETPLARRLWSWRRSEPAAAEGPDGAAGSAPGADPERAQALLDNSVRWVAMGTIVLLGVQLVVIVLQLTQMANDPGMPASSLAAYSTGWFVARLVLLVLGAGLLGVVLARLISAHRPVLLVATVATLSFLTVLASEIIGRSLFYDSMTRIGM